MYTPDLIVPCIKYIPCSVPDWLCLLVYSQCKILASFLQRFYFFCSAFFNKVGMPTGFPGSSTGIWNVSIVFATMFVNGSEYSKDMYCFLSFSKKKKKNLLFLTNEDGFKSIDCTGTLFHLITTFGYVVSPFRLLRCILLVQGWWQSFLKLGPTQWNVSDLNLAWRLSTILMFIIW